MENWHLVLGVREGWGQETPIVFSAHDRRHHLYAIGKSGTGKTTLFPSVVATMGADCSEKQAELIVSLVKSDGRVWIAPDGDPAGERHAQTLLTLISPHRFMRWMKMAESKQPTDLSEEQLKKRFTF